MSALARISVARAHTTIANTANVNAVQAVISRKAAAAKNDRFSAAQKTAARTNAKQFNGRIRAFNRTGHFSKRDTFVNARSRRNDL